MSASLASARMKSFAPLGLARMFAILVSRDFCMIFFTTKARRHEGQLQSRNRLMVKAFLFLFFNLVYSNDCHLPARLRVLCLCGLFDLGIGCVELFGAGLD